MKKLMTALPLMTLVLGCSQSHHPSVEQATVDVNSALREPEVIASAPRVLDDAERALHEAQESWWEEDDYGKADHFAYLASRNVELARLITAEEQADRQAQIAARERAERLALSEAQAAAQARAQLGDISRRSAAEIAQTRSELEDLRREMRELRARTTEKGLEVTLGDVLFEFDRSDLKPGAVKSIEPLTTYLRANPETHVVIEGHTDNVGSDEYNLRLSQERAESVKRSLVSAGVDSSRIVARGFGEQYPLVPNDSDAGRLQNRRVNIVILSDGSGGLASEPISRQ